MKQNFKEVTLELDRILLHVGTLSSANKFTPIHLKSLKAQRIINSSRKTRKKESLDNSLVMIEYQSSLTP